MPAGGSDEHGGKAASGAVCCSSVRRNGTCMIGGSGGTSSAGGTRWSGSLKIRAWRGAGVCGGFVANGIAAVFDVSIPGPQVQRGIDEVGRWSAQLFRRVGVVTDLHIARACLLADRRAVVAGMVVDLEGAVSKVTTVTESTGST